MIVDKIYQYLTDEDKTIDKALAYEVGQLTQWSFERQFMDTEQRERKGKIYLSSVGRCPRQTAYSFHGIAESGKESDPRSKMTFFMGDMIEAAIISLAKLALKKYNGGSLMATGKDQIKITFEAKEAEITGHPDGLYASKKEIYLVECKSMSSFGFKDFEKGIVDEAYISQINAYLEGLGLSKCILIAWDKNSNVLQEKIIERSEEEVKKIRENIKQVLKSTPENLPEPPESLKANEKGFYPWNCLYCSWWKLCRTNAEKVVIKGAYKLKEKGLKDDPTGD